MLQLLQKCNYYQKSSVSEVKILNKRKFLSLLLSGALLVTSLYINNYSVHAVDIVDLQNQANEIQNQIDTENQKIFSLDQEIAKNNSEILEAQKKRAQQIELLKPKLKAIYCAGDVATVDIILSAKNFSDFVDKADLVKKIGNHYLSLVEELNKIKQHLDNLQKEVETKKLEASNSKTNLENKKNELTKLIEENQPVFPNPDTIEDDSFEALPINDMPPVSRGDVRYIWPVPSCGKITSHWGDGRGHKGIDICSSGIYGAPIIAAADGVVTEANSSNRWGSGWGLNVVIDHGSGYSTRYAHCSAINVLHGQAVKAGEVIGFVGSTGDSSAPHLHFETLRNGSQYDPESEL